MREEKLKELKLGVKKQQSMFSKVLQESEAAVHASYVLSELIAKHSKPFTDGDFIKECLMKAGEIVCPGNVKAFQSISLSRNTVAERVTDLAANLSDQIKAKSSSFESFSIACDESTDISGKAQLAVFLRSCDKNFNIFEELLELIPMPGTTTGEDIFTCVFGLLQKYNLPLAKLNSVATDGAPSMTGKNKGFVALLRKKLSEIHGSNIHHMHCIIHQEVLCTKVINMENVLSYIKKVINFIRSRGLNQHQFTAFLSELDSEYSGLSYYTEEEFIVREDKAVRDDGTVLVAPRTYPTLKNETYARIFQNQSSYLSKKFPTKRKTPEERKAENNVHWDKQFQQWKKNDIISDSENLINGFAREMDLPSSWIFKTKVMTQRTHLDDFLSGRIIGRLECGRSQLELSDELGIAQSVISRLWQRFQDDGNVSRRYSTSRPRVTTPNEDRYLAVIAKRNRRSTASDLSRQLSSATGTTISRQTVYRRLGKIGLYARRPVRCVPFTATRCRLRLAWSREHVLWSWACVMFSDESRFSLQSDSRQTFIWRAPGTRYHQEKIIERHRYGGAGVLVWGGIILGSSYMFRLEP
ncbi:General transcription factor II-I repeat domain-containing protein 2, partial [Stegodyphus mimosarum]